jgi:hypothetical protein
MQVAVLLVWPSVHLAVNIDDEWAVVPCSYERARRFEGTYRFCLQAGRVSQARNRLSEPRIEDL